MMIRAAEERDAAAVTSCVAEAYAPFRALDLPPVTEGIAEDIRDHHVWVAVHDGAIAGGVVLVMADTVHIANLAVLPARGGLGIGRALIEQATDAAWAAGHDHVTLATHAGMTGTQAFYRRLGWQETGREGQKVYFSMKRPQGAAP
jgi:GNAT superfamily N-acetyltransferase